jgi:hypothetical protein
LKQNNKKKNYGTWVGEESSRLKRMSEKEVEWLRTQWGKNRGAELTIGTLLPEAATSKKQVKRSCEVAAEWALSVKKKS